MASDFSNEVESVKYDIYVEGYLWSGEKGSTVYTRNFCPANIEEAKKLAGDFQSITSIKVVEFVTTLKVKLLMEG